MISDIKETRFGIEGTAASAEWGIYKVFCKNKAQLPYAEKCVGFWNSLDDNMKERLCRYLYRYFKEYEELFEEENSEQITINTDTIINYIGINVLIVESADENDIPAFHIEGSCVWEPEHGLEITVSDNKFLYVGPFEDYGPNTSRLQYVLDKYGYYNEDSQFNMNYVDNE